jgi:hypothetical protein
MMMHPRTHAEHIGTKTTVQIRSHAQKFFNKLERKKEAGEAPAEGVRACMRYITPHQIIFVAWTPPAWWGCVPATAAITITHLRVVSCAS